MLTQVTYRSKTHRNIGASIPSSVVPIEENLDAVKILGTSYLPQYICDCHCELD